MLKMRRFLAFLGAAELIHVIATGIEKRWTSLERAKSFNKLKRERYQVKNKNTNKKTKKSLCSLAPTSFNMSKWSFD